MFFCAYMFHILLKKELLSGWGKSELGFPQRGEGRDEMAEIGRGIAPSCHLPIYEADLFVSVYNKITGIDFCIDYGKPRIFLEIVF